MYRLYERLCIFSFHSKKNDNVKLFPLLMGWNIVFIIFCNWHNSFTDYWCHKFKWYCWGTQ